MSDELDQGLPFATDLEHPALQIIAERFGEERLDHEHFRGEVVWTIEPGELLEFMTLIRDHERLRFIFLSDLVGLEAMAGEPRFWVLYNVHSIELRLRMRIRVPAHGDKVPSICSLYPGADWHEREAFDMYGIEFEGHPRLRRIYMPDDFDGHPLRKDFPLRGKG
ncbi:MAG: NADH-quinone oxidoreductase subunit C [Candidatus Alcyoniella australis]|nr:NADH-quinone oxidoreductase subunit C [Candidatus Alcyoniella australis]